MGTSPFRWRALVAGLAAAVGLGANVQAQEPLAPQQAPAAWIAYAERATDAIAAWLAEDRHAPARVRGYLLAGPKAKAKAVALELKVWVAADGVVSKVDFAPLGDASADADLTASIAGRRLGPPPPHMLQPLRLAIELRPREPEAQP